MSLQQEENEQKKIEVSAPERINGLRLVEGLEGKNTTKLEKTRGKNGQQVTVVQSRGDGKRIKGDQEIDGNVKEDGRLEKEQQEGK